MPATIPPAALVPVTPVFTNTERLALAGFLAGYSGLTRQACELDLRQYASYIAMITGEDLRGRPAEGCRYIFFDSQFKLAAVARMYPPF